MSDQTPPAADQLAADASRLSNQQPRSAVTLNDITELALAVMDSEDRIANLETLLEVEKATLKRLTEQELPNRMHDAGKMTRFSMEGGYTVEVKDVVRARPPKEARPKVIEWMRSDEAKMGDLVINTVTVAFGAGEEDEAEKFISNLENLVVEGALKCKSHEREVNYNTSSLDAEVRLRLRAGKTLPALLNVYQGKCAEVKRPKKND